MAAFDLADIHKDAYFLSQRDHAARRIALQRFFDQTPAILTRGERLAVESLAGRDLLNRSAAQLG